MVKKRLLQAVNYKKGAVAADWPGWIGLDKIRQKCSHFSEWIEKLEMLPELEV
jgi:hypothetical protein